MYGDDAIADLPFAEAIDVLIFAAVTLLLDLTLLARAKTDFEEVLENTDMPLVFSTEIRPWIITER